MKPNETAKEFIIRVRDGHKRPDGGGRLSDLPRRVIDPEQVTFTDKTWSNGVKAKPDK